MNWGKGLTRVYQVFWGLWALLCSASLAAVNWDWLVIHNGEERYRPFWWAYALYVGGAWIGPWCLLRLMQWVAAGFQSKRQPD